jgi:hypothetical protein
MVTLRTGALVMNYSTNYGYSMLLSATDMYVTVLKELATVEL